LAKKKAAEKREPRQARIPGTEDAMIKELQVAAEEYAEKRDARQAMLADEVALKGELLALMKKHKKEHYEYQGVEVTLVHEEESVKVKIHKVKEDSED